MTTDTAANTAGKRLTLMRERAGLSKRRLAKLSGVEERQIRYWENDDHEPTPASLRRLIPHIGGTIEFYLGPEEGGR